MLGCILKLSLLSLFCPFLAQAGDFFDPYNGNTVFKSSDHEKDAFLSFLEENKTRLERAEERLQISHVFLNSEAEQYERLANQFHQDQKETAAGFYLQIANIVRNLPQVLGLENLIENYKVDRARFLTYAQKLYGDPHMDANQRSVLLHFEWREIVLRYSNFEIYFSNGNMASQEAFNAKLLRAAIPLYNPVDMQSQAHVTLDPIMASYVEGEIRHQHYFGFGFLTASLSPKWRAGDTPDDHRMILTTRSVLHNLHVRPAFNALADAPLIGMMLEGLHRAKPLHVKLVKPWFSWNPFGTRQPTYNAKANELTLYLENWLESRISYDRPEVNSAACAKYLSAALRAQAESL